MTRPWAIGLFVVLVAGSLLLLVPWDDRIEAEPPRRALAVEVGTATRGPVTEVVFADGNSQSMRKEFLHFESAGRVAYLKSNQDGGPLREGDAVESGELLAELDRRIDDAGARAARAELDTVRAALANAKADYERAKRLREGQVIQANRFDAVETAYEQALASVRAAEARSDQTLASLRQLQLRAPFDGVVAFVNIREGQHVSPGPLSSDPGRGTASTSPLVVIDPEAFEVIVELPVATGRRVEVGQTAYVLDAGTLAGVQEHGFESVGAERIHDLLLLGRVGSVSPAVDPSSRSVRARVVLEEATDGLMDGGYVTVWIETDRRENAIRVPGESLVLRGEDAFAFVVDPLTQIVERRSVAVGLVGEEGVEVTRGLSEGDVLVTKGRFRLTTGMLVRTSPTAEDPR